MSNLLIEVPDDLARSLEGIASAQHRTVQEVAVEGLRSLVEVSPEYRRGSSAAVLRAMRDGPHPSILDVDELDRAIRSGRLLVQAQDIFSGQSS